MRTIEWSLQNGAWDNPTGTFEVEDAATDEEISQSVDEIIQQYVSWGWEDITDKKSKT